MKNLSDREKLMIIIIFFLVIFNVIDFFRIRKKDNIIFDQHIQLLVQDRINEINIKNWNNFVTGYYKHFHDMMVTRYGKPYYIKNDERVVIGNGK